MADVAGWSAETLSELFKVLPAALAWPAEQFGVGAASSASASSLAAAALPAPMVDASKFVVFTGVRDKVLEENIRPHGWAVEPAVTKKTTVLVVADVADADAAESGKVKKARAAGIRIMRISDFRTFATV
jgi:NAD-dependent DNA ligase